MKTTTITLVPEIKGCYGPRVWVSASNKEACSILSILSVWPSFTDTRAKDNDYERCYELPFGFTETYIWYNLISKLNLIVNKE